MECTDEQRLTRGCLAFSLWFLCLDAVLPLITMFGLHVGLYGSPASHREAIRVTGETHLIMFTNMVIEGLVVRRPTCTHGAEVGIYVAACQLHLCLIQGIGGMKIP